MKRIRMDAHSRVEHFVSLSSDKEKAIDYSNMLGVCDGGEKIDETQGHILCCDAHKGEKSSDKVSIKCQSIKILLPCYIKYWVKEEVEGE